MEYSRKYILRTWLLFASFIVALVAYMPDIIDNSSAYNTFRFANYMLFGSLFFLTFNMKHKVYQRIIFVYSFVIYIFLLESLLFSSLGFNIEFNDILEISIPFIAILTGYNINISTKRYLNFLIIYCIAATMLSVYTAYYYIGGFTILDQSLIDSKNALGAILSNSGAIIMCMIFLKDISKSRKIPFVIFFIIICACLLVLRARAAFVALLFCFLVFLWLFFRYKKNKYLILGVIIIILGLIYLFGSINMPAFLKDFFFGTSDLKDLNMVSTGRIDRNLAAIKFISDYPMLGQITNYEYLEWVHNYVLLKVSQYGLLGSFPLLCLYFYLIWTIIKKITRIREFSIDDFGYMTMIIPIIISIMEPSFPFGPGSVQVIVYFMFGYSLNKSKWIFNNNFN